MSIQNLTSSNDWSKARVSKNVFAQLNLTGGDMVFTDVLNITGKGYLSKIIVRPQSSNIKCRIKIIVDGVVKVQLVNTFTNTTTCMGVCLEEFMYNISDMLNFRMGVMFFPMVQSFGSYPETSFTYQNIILNQPIYYNNSLQVQLSSDAQQFYYYDCSYLTM